MNNTMEQGHWRVALCYLLISLLSMAVYLQLDNSLTLEQQWHLLNGGLPEAFSEFVYLFATLPRLVMALLAGAVLGLAGSLLQQITRNPLLSPLTFGTSSGAWLALIIVSVWLPGLDPDNTAIIVMTGALLAMLLVLSIAGLRQLSGMPVVLAGMAVNILLGAIASAIILLRDQHAKQLFIWGAGDLAQNDWLWLQWLLPKLALALPILLLAPRVLALLKLGNSAAYGRGLNVGPVILLLFLATLWLVASVITAVGIISFIGLLAPNIVRLCGVHSPGRQLLHSTLVGAVLLLLTDLFARILSLWTVEVIPTGVTTAICGAPVLLLLALKKLKAEDQLRIVSTVSAKMTGYRWLMLGGSGLFCLICAVFYNHAPQGWEWHWPSAFEWQIRSARVIAALAAGVAMAIAGTLLQRLIYNPLASPDLLGISAGASAALVLYSLLFERAMTTASPFVALTGSFSILFLLLWLARRQQFSATAIVLLGVSLTALVEALIQFSLSNGGENVYSIIGWLSGTTYRVTQTNALLLLLIALTLLMGSLLCHRWLSLISVNKAFALGRGMSVERCYWLLLSIVAACCASVTALLGPIAFIGLLAPHLARMLGAQTVKSQLIAAAIIGASLLIVADWLGRNLLYPSQIAAATLASVIGGSYFIFLLLSNRVKGRL